MIKKNTKQIFCEWENKNKKNILTKIRNKKIRKLKKGEILVKNIFVPLHGSFWLASRYFPLHPRINEFMENDQFVFGNGGVAKIINKHSSVDECDIGDYVAIFGHYPCNNHDCYSCNVLHRYTECQYNQGKIIGHGKNSLDGTVSEYTILPKYSYEVCFKKNEKPSLKSLQPFMFSFLLADIRNALTRIPEIFKGSRMILFGAGYSGSLASYLFSSLIPDAKIFLIDTDISSIKKIKNYLKSDVDYFIVNSKISDELSKKIPDYNFNTLVNDCIDKLSKKINKFFGNKNYSLLMDCSSSNSSKLWSSDKILKENSYVIPFGFSSESIYLNQKSLQKSGLTIMMSRGVGNQRNRKEVIDLIRRSKGKFINHLLVDKSIKINGLDNFYNKFFKNKKPFLKKKSVIISFADGN